MTAINDKRIEVCKLEKTDIQVSLFTDDMIIYSESSRNSESHQNRRVKSMYLQLYMLSGIKTSWYNERNNYKEESKLSKTNCFYAKSISKKLKILFRYPKYLKEIYIIILDKKTQMSLNYQLSNLTCKFVTFPRK